MEKLVHCIAVLGAVFFALLTGNSLAMLRFEQAIRFGSAGIVFLIVALSWAFTKCECEEHETAAQDHPLHGSGDQDHP